MNGLDAVVDASTRHRWMVVLLTLIAVALGLRSLSSLTFDAFPDLTNVQVQVLTSSPGMGAEEVELLVTFPIERALGGVAGVETLRSVSRPGVSAVTVVFVDGTDPWLARQMVKEQVDVARGSIPEGAGTPELAPPTTGLGEVYQFTLRSDEHATWDLYRILQRDVAPRLRAVDGVVEVNAWGGGAPQTDVVLDPWSLVAHGLTFGDIADALSGALAITSGGDPTTGSDRITVRAVTNPESPEALGELVVAVRPDGVVRLQDVASLRPGGALTVGLGSADGQGEAIFVVVQLLAGGDARRVVADVAEQVERVRAALPDGVYLEGLYDREKLVGNTLGTVEHSLVSGGLLVVLVLLLLLGDLRAGLLVASVIPMAMLGAFVGLAMLGMSGNLMSLGAIDFGLVVDGTIVVVESIVALEVSRQGRFSEQVAERARAVGRPVLFAVGILMLVYVPVLVMEGTEGKLFRPMGVTVLLALGTALILSFTWVPAVASIALVPRGDHQTPLLRALVRGYRPLLDRALRRPGTSVLAAGALVLVSAVAAARLGVEFVPQLQEGDLVVQTARLPSISPEEARREATRVERVLLGFPEVVRVASRTGSPGIATDPMGLEEADILVRLAPRETWTTASDTEGLASAMAAALERDAPGPEYTFTQPIEMRFNELLEGITSDVGIAIQGEDLGELLSLGQRIARVLEEVPGAADVRAPTLEGMPGIDVVVRPDDLARTGAHSEDIHGLIGGVLRGVEVGSLQRGGFRDPVVLKTEVPAGVDLADLPLVTRTGAVTIGDVADVTSMVRPAVVRRQGGSRRVVVQANVRGRDLGGFVADARRAVDRVSLPNGVWVTWNGKYEQLAAAASSTAVTVPTVFALVLLVLFQAFGEWKPALLISLAVPAAVSGGVLALWARGLPVSMSAVVGFVALSGIAVMNGIVLVSRTLELQADRGAPTAAHDGAIERFRPVLMTAFVAGIGFLPMAIATGVGSEVQRPLATVVIGGLLTATPVTLLLLPALYGRWFAVAEAGR